MEVVGALKLFAANAMWRFGGSKSAGRSLVHALGSESEDLRTVAGTLLARGGGRAEPLLLQAIDKRQSLPLALTILADLGDDSCRPILHRYVDDPDPETAQAAAQALRVLEFRSRPEGESP